MTSSMVRNQIESSLNAHRGRLAFIDQLNAFAEQQDVLLLSDDLDGLCVLAERYVRDTLRLLENCKVASQQARVEQMFGPLIDAGGDFFLRPPPEAPNTGDLLSVVCCSFMARSLIAIASDRMRAVRGFALLANDPHPEASIISQLIGQTRAERLYDIAETKHDSPAIRGYANSAYLLQNSLRASAYVNDWGGGWEGDARKFAASVGLKLNGGGPVFQNAPMRQAYSG